MKQTFLLFALAAIMLTSCSTAYKTGQTPDDVYYVPTKKVVEDVASNNNKNEEDQYEDNTSSQEDKYLHMKVRNRSRWSSIDDYDYWNDSRYYGYNSYSYASNWYYWNNWNSPYYSGYNNHCCCSSNSIYNPYNTVYIVNNPVLQQANTVRPNLNAYHNNTYNNSNQGLGNSIKKVFGNSSGGRYNNSNSETNQSTNRSYSPSSTSESSKSSSSGSSNSGVSRPTRH